MKKINLLKDLIVLLVLIFSLISLRGIKSEVETIKVELENTKNNLYQTNEVIGIMQSELENYK
tara:strand:+ start:51 stop:239 length:189 start_codon:yes stop_codon:yes gene_type:complete